MTSIDGSDLFHPSERFSAALAEVGLSEVRSYRITVNGETRHHVVAIDDAGDFRTATAWSPAAAAAAVAALVLLSDDAAQPVDAEAVAA